MSQTTASKNRAWQQPSEDQEVSNRSILRIQQLSNELANKFKNLPIFQEEMSEWQISKVLFAARDYSDSNTASSERWYNFRLCDSYGFPLELRDWLLANVLHFECLFDAAHAVERTRASFRKFEQAIRSNDLNAAYDQLIIALAVIPYAGVLLALLEKSAFESAQSQRGTHQVNLRSKGVLFQNGDEQKMISYSLDDFCIGKKELASLTQVEINETVFHGKILSYRDALIQLFTNFLLPFTRGIIPKQTIGPSDTTPYEAGVSDIVGFAIPAYDSYSDKCYYGGMAGWIVVLMGRKKKNGASTKLSEAFSAIDSKEQGHINRTHSWLMLQQHVEAYVRRVREAQMLDIVEEYVEDTEPPPAEVFFLQHIRRICDLGVFKDPRDSLSRIMQVRQPMSPPTLLKDSIPFLQEEDRLLSYVPVSLERLAKNFLALLKHAEQQHRLGRQSGFLAAAHDYSKDLNSNDIRMDRYERHVKQEREKLQSLIEKTSAIETTSAGDTEKSFVVEGLKEVYREYGVPMLDLMALTRYQMMRQKAKDAGSLYEEPQFCVERLIDGAKNDVVRVVNLLVWMRSPEWIDPARALQENGRDFAAWGRVFAYETVASNHLSKIAGHLFHQLGFQLEELDHYFPRPLLRCLIPQDDGERKPGPAEPFLWPQHEGKPVRPHLFGFFPLFVEAMRAAYLHAYTATLDRALSLGRKQDVSRRAVGVLHPFQQFITLRPTWKLDEEGRVRDYRLRISFPGPESLIASDAGTLPMGDWHRESACFQKLVSQWQSSVTNAVTPEQQAPAFSITIASR